MPMNEGDLKHVEALMSKRDHGSLMSLPSERLLLYAELADEVPSLIVEVRRLNLQVREMKEAWDKWMKECFCDHSHFSAVDCPHVRTARDVFERFTDKRKCVCGGTGMGVACESGCPNCGRS